GWRYFISHALLLCGDGLGAGILLRFPGFRIECAPRCLPHRAPFRKRQPILQEERAMSRPSLSWSVFVSVLVLGFALAGPSQAAAATRAGHPQAKKDSDEAKKDDSKSSDKKDEKKDDKEQPKEPPFDKVVKEAKKIEGLFNLYVKEDEGKYYLEV